MQRRSRCAETSSCQGRGTRKQQRCLCVGRNKEGISRGNEWSERASERANERASERPSEQRERALDESTRGMRLGKRHTGHDYGQLPERGRVHDEGSHTPYKNPRNSRSSFRLEGPEKSLIRHIFYFHKHPSDSFAPGLSNVHNARERDFRPRRKTQRIQLLRAVVRS